MQGVINKESRSGSFYDALAKQVRETFNIRMGAYGPNLFATDSKGLSSTYVLGFPEEEQQHHNCNCCRDFIRRFGHAVFIDTDGSTIPALWDHTGAPEEYRNAIKALEERVSKQPVKGQFFTSFTTWGQGETNGWTHFEVQPSAACTSLVSEDEIGERTGETNTFTDTLLRAYNDYPIEVIKEAVNLLESGRCNEARDFSSQAIWFHGVSKRVGMAGKNEKARKNLIRREVATAEVESWCGIGGTVIGLLMDDIKAGMHVDSIVARFNKKTAPQVFQRHVAAPTEGNIKVAQKKFEELGLEEADLDRRTAFLHEIRPFWTPAATDLLDAKPRKMFEGLATKTEVPVVEKQVADGGLITLERFLRDVLPKALKMEAYLGYDRLSVLFFNAPVKENAGRIFFFDHPEDRNPISWYMHQSNVGANNIGLTPGTWVNVPAVSNLPVNWTGGDRGRQFDGTVFLLEGAREKGKIGGCLFPQLLADELREAKRVVEAYGNAATSEAGDGDAIGLRADTPGAKTKLRVTTEFGTTQYVIDRPE